MDLLSGRYSHVTVYPLLAGRLEGKNQPAHFIGVATVCLKLLNVVMPQIAVFREKDYQQTVVIRRLVEEFFLDVEVVVAETVRETDGLAVSSRNVYLGEGDGKSLLFCGGLWGLLLRCIRWGSVRGRRF